MIRLTGTEVAAAVGGRLVLPRGDGKAALHLEAEVSGPVVPDSRQVSAGCLFVAINGEHVDGHEYAAAAHAAGAALVLADRALPGVPCVVVDDTVVALGRLAHAHLERLSGAGRGPVVVAITGSSGKTSTKDLLAQVLATDAPTVAPPGSYNTEVGVPLTVLRADESTRHLIVEMGARGRGHIAYLCGIAPPRIGIVLNVGLAHAGEFGAKEDTAAAKSELVEAVPADGVAVLNADDVLVASMAARSRAPAVTFGETGDVRARDVHLDERGRATFTLVTPAGQAPVSLRLHGRHHIGNALAAAAAATCLGMDVTTVAAALSEATAVSRWRMEVHDRADGVTVVNDAYNANPDSVRVALEALAAMSSGGTIGQATGRRSQVRGHDDQPQGQGPREESTEFSHQGGVPTKYSSERSERRFRGVPRRRSWAVLGEMLELGSRSAEQHEAVGRRAVELGVDRVVAVGAGAEPIYQGATAAAPGRAVASLYVQNAEAAIAVLEAELRPDDVVLVKASRGIGLERVAEALLDVHRADDRPSGSPRGSRPWAGGDGAPGVGGAG
jgi:UDP-N-acetylmuramoyl-tripeptide--D-alanyl-D-alanine ligase